MRPLSARVVLLAALVLVAAGPAAAQSVDERFTVCLACHGADGQSRIPETPSLGGQPSFFVVAQLFLFREGRRDNPAMIAAAKGLTNGDLTAFAERVTKLPPPRRRDCDPPAARVDAHPASPVQVCHSPDFSGRSRCPGWPASREDYLKPCRELQAGRGWAAGGDVTQELAGLSDQDLMDLALSRMWVGNSDRFSGLVGRILVMPGGTPRTRSIPGRAPVGALLCSVCPAGSRRPPRRVPGKSLRRMATSGSSNRGSATTTFEDVSFRDDSFNPPYYQGARGILLRAVLVARGRGQGSST
jgi:cytochrome c553